jgi:hypothetical protein
MNFLISTSTTKDNVKKILVISIVIFILVEIELINTKSQKKKKKMIKTNETA